MEKENQIEKSLIEEMDLGILPKEKQAELISKMLEVLLQRIYVEARSKLTAEDVAALDALIDRDATPEEVEKFLQEKIPDFSEMLKNILANFKAEMLKI